MNYTIPIAAGFLGAYIILSLRDTQKKERILSVLCLVLILILLPMQGGQGSPLRIAASYLCFFISLAVSYALREQISGLYHKITETQVKTTGTKEPDQKTDDGELTEEEEIEMKKQQKLITILCVVLILHMIISTFCIYRLNTKINTLYEITMEQDR